MRSPKQIQEEMAHLQRQMQQLQQELEYTKEEAGAPGGAEDDDDDLSLAESLTKALSEADTLEGSRPPQSNPSQTPQGSAKLNDERITERPSAWDKPGLPGLIKQMEAPDEVEEEEGEKSPRKTAQRDRSGSGERLSAREYGAMGDTEPAKAPRKASQRDRSGSGERLSAREYGAMGDTEPAETPAPVAASEEDFRVAHGGAFDPNSRMDRAKMEALSELRAQNPDLSPTKLALLLYRMKK